MQWPMDLEEILTGVHLTSITFRQYEAKSEISGISATMSNGAVCENWQRGKPKWHTQEQTIQFEETNPVRTIRAFSNIETEGKETIYNVSFLDADGNDIGTYNPNGISEKFN